MSAYEADVVEVIEETPRDRTFVLALEPGDGEPVRHRPGQYVVVAHADAPDARRAYSISSAPEDPRRFSITVRATAGAGPERFFGLRLGARLRVAAPRGGFLRDAAEDGHLVLAAGGSGVTPFRALVAHRTRQPSPGRVQLLQSARSPEELVFLEELAAHAAAHDWFTYVPTLTRGDAPSWPGRRGRVDRALLAEALGALEDPVLYACGPRAFVEQVLATGEALGLPPERLRREDGA